MMGLIERSNAQTVESLSRTIKLDQLLESISYSQYSGKECSKSLQAQLVASSSLLPSDLDNCFTLLQDTSRSDYEHSSQGWHPGKKKREMKLPDLRYILLKDVVDVAAEHSPGVNDCKPESPALQKLKTRETSYSGLKRETSTGTEDVETRQSSRELNHVTQGVHDDLEPGFDVDTCTGASGTASPSIDTLLDPRIAAFLSFMLTYEDGQEVIYCYELHIIQALRGKSLGRGLMNVMEEIGRRVGVAKAMLTVFASNDKAYKFYTALGYTVDEYSPTARKLRNGVIKEPDYLILSRSLR